MSRRNQLPLLFFLLLSSFCSAQDSADSENRQMWCKYPADKGPGAGKHIVLIAGDDEYRSEEALPMLGKILAVHHGFNCTVLFPINEDGIIQPDYQTKIPGMHFLKNADLVVLGLRFRNLPDQDMQIFDDYVESGRPIIGLRTSTHAFRIPANRKFSKYSYNSRKLWVGGFGQKILGDTWVDHHGEHGSQSTRGLVNKTHASHPILRGVTDVWGPTDVYEIKNLPETADVLLSGQVLEGMKPDSKAVVGKVNDPMMPLAWTTNYKSRSGKTNRVFCTTMGASTDFQSEGLRRLVINACYWCTEIETPAENVSIVGTYEPTAFGFGNYQKGRKPAFYDLKK